MGGKKAHYGIFRQYGWSPSTVKVPIIARTQREWKGKKNTKKGCDVKKKEKEEKARKEVREEEGREEKEGRKKKRGGGRRGREKKRREKPPVDLGIHYKEKKKGRRKENTGTSQKKRTMPANVWMVPS